MRRLSSMSVRTKRRAVSPSWLAPAVLAAGAAARIVAERAGADADSAHIERGQS